MEEYNNLLEARAALRESDPHFNSLEFDFEEDDSKRGGDDNELSGKAREVKLDYDRLHKMATNTLPKEFQDDKAQGE